MTLLARELAPDLKARIIDIVRAEAAPLDVSRWEIRCEEDHDGDDAIYVEIWHPLSGVPVGSRMWLRVVDAVQDELLAHGELRLLYVRHHFANDQIVGAVS